MENSKTINNHFPVISECIWSKEMKTWTIAFAVIIIGIFILVTFPYIISGKTIPMSIIEAGLVVLVAIGISLFFCPRRVVVNNDDIQIHLWGRTVNILTDKIDYIEKYTSQDTKLRLCGIGHVFSDTGYFYVMSMGIITAYVTDWSKAYVIYRKNQKPVVVSVEDPTIFAAFMKKD